MSISTSPFPPVADQAFFRRTGSDDRRDLRGRGIAQRVLTVAAVVWHTWDAAVLAKRRLTVDDH